MTLPEVVDVQVGGVDDPVRGIAHPRERRPLMGDALLDRTAALERMRPARFV